jgi:hypothetical protein
MKIDVTITRLDLIALNLLIMSRVPLYQIAFGVLLVCFQKMALTGDKPWTLQYLGASFTVSVVAAITAMIVLGLISGLATALSSKHADGTLGEHTFALTSHGLEEKTAVNSGMHSWKAVKQIIETRHYLIIQVGAFMFHIIPRRAFPAIADFRAFCNEARVLYAGA